MEAIICVCSSLEGNLSREDVEILIGVSSELKPLQAFFPAEESSSSEEADDSFWPILPTTTLARIGTTQTNSQVVSSCHLSTETSRFDRLGRLIVDGWSLPLGPPDRPCGRKTCELHFCGMIPS